MATSHRPSISVLIPAYNAAATVGDAVESVLSQAPAPEQVIVSDDGSEDDLDAALQRFGDRIEVVRGPNAGLATARNRAASVASGELLALLDADDVWLPGRAAAFRDAARTQPEIDIFTTDAFVVRSGRREPGTYYASRRWPDGDQPTAILRSSFIFGAAAIRRRAFEAVGGYDPAARFAEDWDLWIRMLFAGSRALLIDSPLYEYRRRRESLTGQRVELSLGVLATLERARSLSMTEEQARVLQSTIGEWRLRAAREAHLARDARRHRLSFAAARDRSLPFASRVKVLARSVVPGRESGRLR